MKRVAIVLIFSIVILNLYILTSKPAIAAFGDLELKMSVDRGKVPRGTKIKFTLTLTNIGQNEITVTFSSGQAFDLYYYASLARHSWSDGKAFILLVWDVTLKPKEHFSQTLEWDLYQYDRTTGKFVPPPYGTYDVWGTCVGTPGATTVSPTPITLCVLGDVNYDHSVNSLDISTLNSNWAPANGAPPWSRGYSQEVDTNGDGYINGLDVGTVNANWGQTG